MSYYETPFCVCFYYIRDEELDKKRIELLDSSIDYLLSLIDLFAYEYKWTKEAVLAIRCTERDQYVKRIMKRREESGGIDSAFQT